MRSKVVLNHPWREPPQTWWYFSGSDDRALRRYAEELGEYEAPDPDDRNVAALVLSDDDQENPRRGDHRVSAWTAAGALKFAGLLPDRFADVSEDIVRLLAGRGE